ncbi:MAG: substrate-binding domain-containing protein [Elusimicrobia bacterium]|nr:substrate-binding domain-containing protein [Elusimicrobiota bacterium]
MIHPIGVVTHPAPDLSAPYFAETLSGLGQTIPHFLLNPSTETPVSGLLFLAPGAQDPCLARAVETGLPAVILNGEGAGLPSMDLDNAAAAHAVVSHLLKNGGRRIALINGKLETANGAARQAGYQRALEEAGLPWDPARVETGNFSRAGGRWAMERFLALEESPDAVFAANDHMALGARDVLLERGRRVPDDVLLAGFDDIPEAATAGLTTVRQPLSSMARLAGEWLSGWIRSGRRPDPERVRVPGELIVRSSSGPRFE